jgi:hypothetical protein
MGLLKPRKRRGRPLRTHTTMHCVMARGQVGWCRGLCTPMDGLGPCGRVAPHALLGRTQSAIARSKRRPPRPDDSPSSTEGAPDQD